MNNQLKTGVLWTFKMSQYLRKEIIASHGAWANQRGDGRRTLKTPLA